MAQFIILEPHKPPMSECVWGNLMAPTMEIHGFFLGHEPHLGIVAEQKLLLSTARYQDEEGPTSAGLL